MALKYNDSFQPHIDKLEFGETVRVCHTDCTAGEDTRNRLYITKPATGGGEVLAYCHNCQLGAKWRGGESYRISTIESPTSKVREGSITMDDYEEYNEDWPGEAKRELFQYGIIQSMAALADIRYDPSTHRLVFPVYQSLSINKGVSLSGTLKGIQKRRLIGTGTKYTTEMNNESYDLSSILSHSPMDHKDHIGVIVEDYLSAVRILSWAYGEYNVKVLCNYGTKVNPEAIKNMTDVSKLIVWLDNDNDHVCEQANTIAKVARLVQPSTTGVLVEEVLSDPKRQSYGSIGEVLCG